ncbi:hypothetical protein BZM26_00810 [Paraburkholderia strydomiana]|nr:hypothetical protein BZM26_00810 [Paraburkholderia strydomiana]
MTEHPNVLRMPVRDALERLRQETLVTRLR